MIIVIALLVGVAAASVALAVAVLAGVELPQFNFDTDRRSISRWLPSALAAVAVGVCMLVWTSAVVFSVGLAAVVVGVPEALRQRRADKRELERLDAVASFASQVAQSFRGGNGLVQSLINATVHPPASIADELTTLRTLLQAAEFTRALERFAADMNTPLASKLAVNLILAEQEHATELGQRLETIAKTAQETAEVSREVRRERISQAFQVKALSILSGFAVTTILLVSPGALHIFSGSVVGELKLAFVVGCFLGAWTISQRIDQNVALEQFELRPSQ